MKKFIFPFFSVERHGFLIKKWWFRLLIVVYIILFVVAPFLFFSNYMENAAGWCYSGLPYLHLGNDAFNTELAKCSQFAKEAWTPAIITAILGTIVIHYLIQFIFFKIIINFVVMGGKKTDPNA